MNTIEFKNRLILILRLRSKITRQELVKVLNSFWQFNKPNIQANNTVYLCYSMLVSVLRKFDEVIYTHQHYYYVYKDVLVEHLKTYKC